MATISHNLRGWPRSVLALAAGIFIMASAVAKAESDTPAGDGKGPDTAITNGQDAFRAYIQIQEQLHNTLLAIEKNRIESETAAASNAAAVEMRLNNVEKALESQRRDDLKEVEGSSRAVLMAAGAFTIIGFIVLTVAVFLLRSAVTRLATATARLPSGASLQALGEGQIPTSLALEQSTSRFMGIVERLEQRILGMEATIRGQLHLPEGDSSNGAPKSLASDSTPELPLTGEFSPVTAKANAISMLLAKGQTLLKLDKPEDALGCIDEALGLDPDNADALIKKGAALERLQRLTEAIDCYDRVIARDNTMTMAYLYKGAVFNRMECYNEALECYEQALKTRQKAEPIVDSAAA